jgi:hypothetical protein
MVAWRETSAEPQVQSVIQCDDRADVCRDAGWHTDPWLLRCVLVRCRGDRGSRTIGGVLDVHAAVISIATQVNERTITSTQAIVPVLIALTAATPRCCFRPRQERERLQHSHSRTGGIIAASWIAGLVALQIL